MDDAQLVTVNKGIKDWCNNIPCLSLIKSFLLQDLVEKLHSHEDNTVSTQLHLSLKCFNTYLSTNHKLHNKEEVLVILIDIK